MHKLLKLPREIYLRFHQDGCTSRAASLAFTTLLSIVPLLTVSFFLLTLLPISQKLAATIQNFVFQNFVPASAEIIQYHLTQFVHHTSKLSAIGTLFLFATAILMVFNLERAFNIIWRAKKQRSFLSAFVMYWAVLTLTPILIGLGLAISTYLFSLPLISTAARVLGLKEIIFIATPYISTFVAFTVLYLAVPNCKVSWRYALIGGFVATILFELAKLAFVLYITHFPVYRLLYGALSAIPIFLVWIYLCWLIILFGAVVTAVLEDRMKTRRKN
jgi:membrane protein